MQYDPLDRKLLDIKTATHIYLHRIRIDGFDRAIRFIIETLFSFDAVKWKKCLAKIYRGIDKKYFNHL